MRLIDADAYQKALEDKAEQLKSRNIIDDALNDTINGLCGAVSILYEQPTVQPHETGHWIPVYQGDEIINYRCSECEHGETFGASTYRRDYCNCCGARMNKERK